MMSKQEQPNFMELKEIGVEHVSLEIHDALKSSELSAEELVQTVFLLMDDQLSSEIPGLSTYQRENLLQAIASGAQMPEVKHRQVAFYERFSPDCKIALTKLINRELKALWPEESLVPTSNLQWKIKALVLARARKGNQADWKPADTPQTLQAPKKTPQHQTAGFKIIVSNFAKDKRTKFQSENEFFFYFHESFEQLIDMLEFRTRARDIPPPEPKPNFKPLSPRSREILGMPTIGEEMEAKTQRSRSSSASSERSVWHESVEERPSLEYSEAVLAREENDMSGYTLKEGPWIYRIEMQNGFPQHLLSNQDDFETMVNFLKNIKKDHCFIDLVVRMIHSQDRIGQKKWTKQLRKNVKARQERQAEEPYFDEDEFNRVVEERYGEPSKERVVEGLEHMLSF